MKRTEMNKIEIAGIKRANQFSPNHIDNDAAIFNMSADYLREKGFVVNEYTEDEFLDSDIKEEFIFNMVRDWRSIKKLQQLESNGAVVVNSGFGIENCTREKMTRLLMTNNVPHPESIIKKTNFESTHDLEELGFSDCWIKRGDFHAVQKEDVTYARSIDEARSVLRQYAMRGIETAVINEHLVGDLVKFYGVVGTDYFYWFYPSDIKHSKFGLEKINGIACGYKFSESYLKDICTQAAQVLRVHIYGGDCVVAEDGTIRIIDFNDWPSFAPCRDTAAPMIAECIQNVILNSL